MKKIGSFISIIIALFIVVLVISDWTQQSEIKRADNPDKKGLASYQKGQVEKEISISQVCTIDKKGRIFVDVDPKDARIRIMNIKPKFYQGMELPPGRYRVKIDKNGYKTISEWVSLGIGQALTATVILQKIQYSAAGISDSQIIQQMIRESIAKYPGNCPCPYSRASNGSRCGGRSAWSRPGGYEPLCYESDITPEMLENYKKRMGLK